MVGWPLTMPLKPKSKKISDEGMHPYGHGLYLSVKKSGARAWIYRYQLDGRRREMGIGSTSEKSLTEARAEAAQWKLLVSKGIDPIDHRCKLLSTQRQKNQLLDQQATKFEDIAKDYIAAHKISWRNSKHAAQWLSTLQTYAFPKIGSKSPREITVEDILSILSPIWSTKTETASRVRSRIEIVLNFAKAKKLRENENPANWRGNLESLLPKPSKVSTVKHHPALPFTQIPDFFQALQAIQGIGARALEFLILTAARSIEVRLARWQEIDFQQRIWTVPAEHMKAHREHRVPLSDRAIQLLNALPRPINSELLFPGERLGRPLSDMTISAVIRRMNNINPAIK